MQLLIDFQQWPSRYHIPLVPSWSSLYTGHPGVWWSPKQMAKYTYTEPLWTLKITVVLNSVCSFWQRSVIEWHQHYSVTPKSSWCAGGLFNITDQRLLLLNFFKPLIAQEVAKLCHRPYPSSVDKSTAIPLGFKGWPTFSTSECFLLFPSKNPCEAGRTCWADISLWNMQGEVSIYKIYKWRTYIISGNPWILCM